MIQVSDILREAYRKLGKPSQADMPFIDLIAIVADVYRGVMLDLKMTARNHSTVLGAWTVPTDREMSTAIFTGGDHIIPINVEWRPADSPDISFSYPVEIIAFEQIGAMPFKTDMPYVAFYNGFANVRFSDVDELMQSREYRFTYEPLGAVNIDEVTDLTELPPLFLSYLSDEVSVRALDMIDGNDAWAEKRERLRPMLLASLGENKARFNKFRMTQFGNKIVRKQPPNARRGYAS